MIIQIVSGMAFFASKARLCPRVLLQSGSFLEFLGGFEEQGEQYWQDGQGYQAGEEQTKEDDGAQAAIEFGAGAG